MTLVIDTNVLVSGLLAPSGPPGQIADLVVTGEVQLLVDDRILVEYRRVLTRGRFGFDPADVDGLLRYIELTAESVSAAPLEIAVPDRSDLPFLEVAVTGRAEALVTGNVKHFAGAGALNVPIITPEALMRRIRGL